jgi:hypothetical protein
MSRARARGPITLSARQLLTNQRIAQAAVRRANGLAERVPRTLAPFPDGLSPGLDRFLGVLPDGKKAVMQVTAVQRRGTLGDRAPVAVGDLVPVVIPFAARPPFGDGAPISAFGIFYRGTMFGVTVSIEPPPGERPHPG